MPVDDGTLKLATGTIDVTEMRIHELALQNWFNQIFLVREGYPVPVVFSSPMDAYAHFKNLWAMDKNPFAYLYAVKDDLGNPAYEPHPTPPKYPLLSVHRKNWAYRPSHNFSIHPWRRINWPTVSADVDKNDLANVTVGMMPMAMNLRYQLDHFCLRPDTQALFVRRLFREFARTGGQLQAWIPVVYPGWGTQNVRVSMEGDIENMTPEEPEDNKQVEFRTSCTLIVEGYSVDVDFRQVPAVWSILFGGGTPAPDVLQKAYSTHEEDLRVDGRNETLEARGGLPA